MQFARFAEFRDHGESSVLSLAPVRLTDNKCLKNCSNARHHVLTCHTSSDAD